MTDIVRVENLVKRYDDLIALDHFNLSIAPGEIFGNCILKLSLSVVVIFMFSNLKVF